ncbi:MAG: segregation/condensation protein A [SAR116 cluster bacterium]|nr:segregation/condensation protein A [Paracoccaceae bacterium]RCL79185.1 MAG: segregation/condensation protein A [SAR116 cluster bacterium]HBQ22667.1 segregation/condensation protein A [Alphaproteobacteria bacterium]HCJ62527.1 segregation/condensation protein A [Alphaproteobacteria bacterium]
MFRHWQAYDAMNMHDDRLDVSLDGFEGPLDLLLDLARRQKVDLLALSIIDLADQYLAYIADLKDRRMDVAADYLVMAAWLTYLKSRLLLPKQEAEEPDAEWMAHFLAHRLHRLEAMREAGNRLFGRSLLGQDRFARGAPEPIVTERQTYFDVTLLELARAYGMIQLRKDYAVYEVRRPRIYTMEQALLNLDHVIGGITQWRDLAALMPELLVDAEPEARRSAVAGTFAATLELVRRGRIELRQDKPFAPIEIRARQTDEDQAPPYSGQQGEGGGHDRT